MKIKIAIPFFAVFLLVLMGCTQDEVLKEDTSVGGKEKISVTVTQGGRQMMPLNFMVLRLRSLLRQDLLMVMARLLLSQEMRLRMPSMLSFLHQKPRKDGRIATLML